MAEIEIGHSNRMTGSKDGSTQEIEAPPPLVGAAVVAGLQSKMEDAVTIKDRLCSPIINRCLPVHYYGLFDGHGGPHFAIMCKEKLHEILKEELMNLTTVRQKQIADESVLQEIWKIVLSRVFWRTELVAQNTCVCGSVGFRCDCERSAVSFSGTTAVVVVLTEKHFVVGNCGDSRAVLYRGGMIIPLTFDHKPSRGDEKARIEASGGHVTYTDVARVQGILAMSRAIGDMYIKSLVISEPEVTFTRRHKEDEFLILASDGMWDVIPTTMAGRVVHGCLKEIVPRGNSKQVLNSAEPENHGSSRFRSRSESAAVLLSHLALARGCSDNISVVVVDLKRDITGGSAGFEG